MALCSCGGACDFYPRSPCGERLLEQSASYNAALENFYPRSPCGERPDTSIIILDEYQFLSTLSLRRATDDLQVPASVSKISIHALLAESDGCQRPCERPTTNFYPRSPCGERHIRANFCLLVYYFYPRSPCGERLYCHCWHLLLQKISIHALLAESDPTTTHISTLMLYFYPRSPCGERLLDVQPKDENTLDFYPRSPCGERPLQMEKGG